MVLTGPVIRRRLAACMLAFFVLFLILSVRLFILQGVQAEDLQRRAGTMDERKRRSPHARRNPRSKRRSACAERDSVYRVRKPTADCECRDVRTIDRADSGYGRKRRPEKSFG